MKKIFKIQRFVFILSFCLGFVSGAFSQSQPSVNVTANRDKVLLGEHIELRVQANVPAILEVTDLFHLPDTLQHLEILQRGAIDSTIDGGTKLYSQSFTITGFDSGTWVFPPMAIRVNNKTYRSKPLPITIVPVQLTDSTYHDIREIIEVPPPATAWWYWVAAALSAILLGILVWLWWKSRKKKQVLPGVAPVNDPGALEAALQQLRALEKEQLPEKGALTDYYSLLGNIVRGYTQKRFGIRALQFTTDELLVQLHSTLRREQPGKLAELLRIADAVKFAKFRPDIEQCRSDIKNAETIMKEMDMLKQYAETVFR